MRRVLGIWVCGAIAMGASARVHAGVPGIIDDRDPASGRSIAADPGPAPDAGTSPSPSPGSPSPSSGVAPGNGGGDAQSAPVSRPPPGTPAVAADGGQGFLPRRRFCVMPRFAYRLGEAGRAVSPASGFGVGGTIEISYARLGAGANGVPPTAGGPNSAGVNPQLEAALGIDFSYDRFAAAEQGSAVVDTMVETFASTRVVSETSFVLVHTVAVRIGPVRPYLTVGGGLGLGYFDSATLALRPGTAQEAHLLGRVAFGVDVSIARSWNLAVRADYTVIRGASPLVIESGRSLSIFGDLLDLNVGLAFRF